MQQRTKCNICGEGSFNEAQEISTVHSNARKWKKEKFTVWRCPHCNSIHSLECVDLSKYYAAYPYRARRLDNWARRAYKTYINKLKKYGLNSHSSVIDYGCSEGLFLDYLKENGIENCSGYDAYIEKYADISVLKKTEWDFVVAQDVIEHVEDPRSLFKELMALVKSGGFLVIGTPNADALDLKQTEKLTTTLIKRGLNST